MPQIDLNALGSLDASAQNAKSYRFVIAKRSSGLTAEGLAGDGGKGGAGVVVDETRPDAGGRASLDLRPLKGALEQAKASGEELLTFVVGDTGDAATPKVGAAGPTLTFEAAPASGTLEEKRYDFFRDFVRGAVAQLVGAGTLPAALKNTGDKSGPRYPVEFIEGEGAINVIAVRSMADWTPQPPREFAFDDWMVQCWIEGGKKRCAGWKCTTDPGRGYTKNEGVSQKWLDRKSVSHLANGHWRFALGQHDGHPAGQGLSIGAWEDKKNEAGQANNVQDANEGVFLQTGAAIKIHWAYETGDANNVSSAGCQAVHAKRTSPEWAQFMAPIQKASNAACFPYTLVDANQIPGAVPMA